MADITGLMQIERSAAGEKKTPEQKKLWDYLYRLTEELRYVLGNLDEDNMSAGTAQNLMRLSSGLKDQVDKRDLHQALEQSTKLITGNAGGYVVLRDADGDGKPDEILIMDREDRLEARKVWRWNAAGLGYSSSGCEGPFDLAITADGQITADFVTTGTLNAAQVHIINLIADTVSSVQGDRELSVSSGRLALVQGGQNRVVLNSDVQDGGFVQITKHSGSDDVRTVATGDALYVGESTSNAAKVEGSVYAGLVSGTSLAARGTDPWIRVFDSSGKERIGLYGNVGRIAIYNASGNEVLSLGSDTRFTTLNINGTNYKVLTKD